MSNSIYGSRFFVYPNHRNSRNSAMAAGSLPANQIRQVFVRPSNHSSASAPASSFPGGALHLQPSFHSPKPHSQASAVSSRQFSPMPARLEASQFASYPPMDPYSMPHGGAFVTAAELQIEPRAHYPADIHSTLSMPYAADPMVYGSVEHGFAQMQETQFDAAMSSPSNIGSPHDFGSPSVAGSGVSEKAADQPYAKLIFEALKGAPNHSLILREIYAWFEHNTDKPQRAPGGKQGWKNSIRHNLSMNEAFEKVAPASLREREGNKGCTWKLSQKALTEGGVLSTTRYRTKNNKRRQNSDVLHQRSGDGGRILKRSPPRDLSPPRHESVFGQIPSSPTNFKQEDFSMSEPYLSESMFHYPSAQVYGAFAPSEMSHAPEAFSSLSSDNSMLGGCFNLYEYAGTPTSSAATVTDSVPSRHSPAIKTEGYELEGVSEHAAKYELFKEDEPQGVSRQHSILTSAGSTELGVECVPSAGLNDITGLSMAGELSNWSLEHFGQMEDGESQDQPQYFFDF